MKVFASKFKETPSCVLTLKYNNVKPDDLRKVRSSYVAGTANLRTQLDTEDNLSSVFGRDEYDLCEKLDNRLGSESDNIYNNAVSDAIVLLTQTVKRKWKQTLKLNNTKLLQLWLLNQSH